MAKAEMDMVREVLGWPLSAEQKLALIDQIVGGKAAPKPAAKARAKAAPTAAAKAPTAAPAKVVKRRKRSTVRPQGSGYTHRSELWNELKRLAPEKVANLSYTNLSTEMLEPMVAEARKAK